MLPATTERDGSITLRIDNRVYSIEAVRKAAHKFTTKFVIAISVGDDAEIRCNLHPRSPGGQADVSAGEFMNELLDQMLRMRLREETEAVRRLILAQAFSRTDAANAPDADSSEQAEP